MKAKQFNHGLMALVLSSFLAACSGGDTTPAAEAENKQTERPQPTDPGHTNNDRASLPGDTGLGCGWQFASNIDTMNIAFPDESAKYWVALVPMLPQTRVRIDGYFPDARYFSFNVYDGLLRPTDAIADSELIPAEVGRNSAVEEMAAWGDAYTAYVEFTPPPAERAANTVYAGEMQLGPQPIPQPALTAIFYRIYVPGEDKEFDGGVGLPLLTYEMADGSQEIVPTGNCAEPLLPTLGNNLPSAGANDLLRDTGFPDEVVSNLPLYLGLGDTSAKSQVFYGLTGTAFNIMRGILGLPIPEGIEHSIPLGGGGGFLSNKHNHYLTNLFTRSYGNVALVRAKAPTFRSQQGVGFGEEQLRYWSICQNDLPTQRYVGCYADYQIELHDDGYFYVMVSDAEDRPSNAEQSNAINWLAWGPYYDSLLIYRHMLADPDFAETISNVPAGTPPIEVMGEYLTEPAYCTTEIVESAGNNPADIFAACRAYTETLAPWSVK